MDSVDCKGEDEDEDEDVLPLIYPVVDGRAQDVARI